MKKWQGNKSTAAQLHVDDLRQLLHAERKIHLTIARLPWEPETLAESAEKALLDIGTILDIRPLHLIHFDRNQSTITRYGTGGSSETQSEVIESFISELLRIANDLQPVGAPDKANFPLNGRYSRLPASVVMTSDRQIIALIAQPPRKSGGRPILSEALDFAVRLIAELFDKVAIRMGAEHRRNQLEKTRQMEAIAAFAGSFGHEFNNLLAAMMGYTEMAVEAIKVDALPRSYLENVIAAGRQAQAITEKSLTFSFMQRSTTEPIEFLEAMSEVLPALYACVGKDVPLHVELPDRPFIMAGSTTQLQHILQQVCKYTCESLQGISQVRMVAESVISPTPRKLSHGSLQIGHYLRITVSDGGHGTAPEHFIQICDPFFTTKARRGGPGLGLALIDGAVHALQGSMHVCSSASGGSRFELFFPQL